MDITRRSLLKASFALAVTSAVPSLVRASLSTSYRALNLYNTHTGESLKTVYWEQGAYHKQALSEIAHLLRDHRNGEAHSIDPQLLDMLHRLHARIGSAKPYEVISGYRSPESNAMMHARSGGVAKNSLHMEGRAIDIRLTDRPLSSLRNAAWNMQQGGVGYYPGSDFVHLDTGRIRSW